MRNLITSWLWMKTIFGRSASPQHSIILYWHCLCDIASIGSDIKARAPSGSKAKISLLGDYDPQGERIIEDPYCVSLIFYTICRLWNPLPLNTCAFHKLCTGSMGVENFGSLSGVLNVKVSTVNICRLLMLCRTRFLLTEMLALSSISSKNRNDILNIDKSVNNIVVLCSNQQYFEY